MITARYACSRPIFTQSVVGTSPDHVRDRSLIIVRGVGGGEHLGHLFTFQSGFLFVLFESIFSDNFLYSFKIFQSSYRLAIGYFAGKDKLWFVSKVSFNKLELELNKVKGSSGY